MRSFCGAGRLLFFWGRGPCLSASLPGLAAVDRKCGAKVVKTPMNTKTIDRIRYRFFVLSLMNIVGFMLGRLTSANSGTPLILGKPEITYLEAAEDPNSYSLR